MFRILQTSMAENRKANRCPNWLGQLVSFHCHYMRGTAGKCTGFGIRHTWIFIPALLLSSPMAMGKVLNFSEGQVP